MSETSDSVTEDRRETASDDAIKNRPKARSIKPLALLWLALAAITSLD